MIFESDCLLNVSVSDNLVKNYLQWSLYSVAFVNVESNNKTDSIQNTLYCVPETETLKQS